MREQPHDDGDSTARRAFEADEFDTWARPWIQSVKLVPEYVEHWASIRRQFGARQSQEELATVRANWDPQKLGAVAACQNAWVWLARGWRLPAGPVDPFDFTDYGASIDMAVLRAARMIIPTARPVQEVDFNHIVEVFQGLAASADYCAKLQGIDKQMAFEIFAGELKHQIGREPWWPIPPVIRLDIDLLQPNDQITQHLDALRRLHRVESSRRPRRSADSNEGTRVGFRILHDRRASPKTTWRELYARHIPGTYDDDTRERLGRRWRKRATEWILTVRREVLADHAAPPRSGYALAVVKVDGAYRVQTVWREPKRVRGGYVMETKRVIRWEPD